MLLGRFLQQDFCDLWPQYIHQYSTQPCWMSLRLIYKSKSTFLAIKWHCIIQLKFPPVFFLSPTVALLFSDFWSTILMRNMFSMCLTVQSQGGEGDQREFVGPRVPLLPQPCKHERKMFLVRCMKPFLLVFLAAWSTIDECQWHQLALLLSFDCKVRTFLRNLPRQGSLSSSLNMQQVPIWVTCEGNNKGAGA